MYYDLDILEELSHELGFASNRISSDNLEITLVDDIVLVYRNLRDEEDTVSGIKGTPSHTHGKLILMTGDSTYIELDELDVLQGINNGDILINERYINKELSDRWLSHKKEKMDLKYIQPGEELRIRRLA